MLVSRICRSVCKQPIAALPVRLSQRQLLVNQSRALDVGFVGGFGHGGGARRKWRLPTTVRHSIRYCECLLLTKAAVGPLYPEWPESPTSAGGIRPRPGQS